MKTPYTFSILRYIHDPLTREFANIGVALYAPEAKYAGAICTSQYSRLSKMFGQIDGERFRQITWYVETRIEEIGERLRAQLPFPEQPKNIEALITQVLPTDDSAIQFSSAGGGFTENPEKTLSDLYQRYVEYYASRPAYPSRDDEEVWRIFRKPLEEHGVIQRLAPKLIVAPDYEYEFKEAWKNEVWHAYEPVSFDLMESTSIVDKANTWLGRITSLAASPERFKPYLLLGEPHEEKLRGPFVKAQNILHKMPCKPVFIREADAEAFAKELKAQIGKHGL
ncbi:MAG: DUF3037 domain-containing protein [Terriglobia bacterium]